MEQGYLIDTNAIIDYLDSKLSQKATSFLDNIELQLSVISRIELLGWHKATEQQLTMLGEFIGVLSVLGINEAVVLESIEIRKKYKVKLPDAIIAATASTNNFVLITRNIRDFKGIPNLKVLDPYSL